MRSWWAGKTRQALRYLTGRVSDADRAMLARWLTADQLRLFEAIHRADQRHGLDVVIALRRAGHEDPDLLVAGLFHDAAKGPTVGFWPRVAWSLADRYGGRMRALGEAVPGFRAKFARLDDHAEGSARLALAAGCSPRAAELIRAQAGEVDPATGIDPGLGEALRLADEAN